VIIRSERPADIPMIHAVNRHAFGRAPDETGEAELVDRLRADGAAFASLVADDGGEIVGHILFTRLQVRTGSDVWDAAALAPMAVHPARQREGIGAKLISEGISACRACKVPAIIVLGHTSYYPRFGFSVDAARDLVCPFSGPHLMALKLDAACILKGTVEYPRAFFEVI
jgi:putative acetyltransferase